MREPKEIAELLVSKASNSDINARNLEGCIPFHLAVQNVTYHLQEDSPSMFGIVENGRSDVTIVNHKGDSPLHLYLQNRRLDFLSFKYLIDHNGACVNIVDSKVTEPMGENPYQAYCRAVDEDNRTPDPTLQMLLQGHKLLKFGANVNAVDTFGYPPLFYAFSSSRENKDKCLTTVRLLLDFDANINHQMDFKNILDDADNIIDKGIRINILLFLFVTGGNIFSDLQGKPNIFYQHLAKFSALQEKVTGRVINVAEMFHLYVDHFDLFDYNTCLPLCSKELEAMTETKIGESGVSFLNVLFAKANKPAINTRNKELVKAFHAGKVAFPMYQGFLDAKIDKVLRRQELIEEAAVVLSNAMRFADPSDEFFVKTLSYCSNKDLMNVIDALDGIEDGLLDAAETTLTAETGSSMPDASTFDFDDFKRVCRDYDETKFISYIEKLDSQRYSFWFCEYKYPEELERVITSCDLIDGIYKRLHKLRKTAFASMCLFGTNNDSTISGIWIWRESAVGKDSLL